MHLHAFITVQALLYVNALRLPQKIKRRGTQPRRYHCIWYRSL